MDSNVNAYAVKQQCILCFALPYRDFLKVANLTFQLGWEIVNKGSQVDSHGHNEKKKEEEGFFRRFE